MTAADDKFFDIFSIFEKNKVRYLMKHHALLLFSEKVANLKLWSAANYRWRFKG